MWIGVTARFSRFHENLTPTDKEKEDGATKHEGVRKCLNSHYYGVSSIGNSFLGGSWGKYTRIRPLRDIDVYFVLPYEVHQRFTGYVGNKQSALLQEVKNVLLKTYPTTDMSGDGQVVVVKFNSIDVEVVPVFLLGNGKYYVCNTHDGGSYTTADPDAEAEYISVIDSSSNNNLRMLIRMLKAWQDNCNVPLKSFYLELLAADYMSRCQWRKNGYFYSDWIIRDFFGYLVNKNKTNIFVPGTGEIINIGDNWYSKCQNAFARSLKACDYEHKDYTALAGEEWQKIFGNQVPIIV